MNKYKIEKIKYLLKNHNDVIKRLQTKGYSLNYNGMFLWDMKTLYRYAYNDKIDRYEKIIPFEKLDNIVNGIPSGYKIRYIVNADYSDEFSKKRKPGCRGSHCLDRDEFIHTIQLMSNNIRNTVYRISRFGVDEVCYTIVATVHSDCSDIFRLKQYLKHSPEELKKYKYIYSSIPRLQSISDLNKRIESKHIIRQDIQSTNIIKLKREFDHLDVKYSINVNYLKVNDYIHTPNHYFVYNTFDDFYGAYLNYIKDRNYKLEFCVYIKEPNGDKELNIHLQSCENTKKIIDMKLDMSKFDDYIFTHGVSAYNRNILSNAEKLVAFNDMEICCAFDNQYVGPIGFYIKGECLFACNKDMNSHICSTSRHRYVDNLLDVMYFSIDDPKDIEPVGVHGHGEAILTNFKITGMWANKSFYDKGGHKYIEKVMKIVNVDHCEIIY